MKKMLTLLIAVLLIVSLAACSKPEPLQEPTEAPADNTMPPADVTEPPADVTEAPADPLARLAWPTAERIAQVHNVTVSSEGDVAYKNNTDAETAAVTFTDGGEDPSTVITVHFEKDGDNWKETGAMLDLFFADQPDEAKFESDLAAFIPFAGLTVTEEELLAEGYDISRGSDVSAFAAEHAAGEFAKRFTACAEDNYFRCTEAQVVALNGVNAEEGSRYSVSIVVRPVNERYFLPGFGDIMGPLYRNAEKPEYEFLWTLSIKINVADNGGGSYAVTFDTNE